MISISQKGSESVIGKLADRLNNNLQLWDVIGQKAHKFMANDHFRDQKNRNGESWKLTWSHDGRDVGYRPYPKGGNAMLRNYGTMRSAIYWTASRDGVTLISPVSYSKYHHGRWGYGDVRKKMPLREFMYVTKEELGKLVAYMMRELFRGL
jgi:hypothetical protein